MGELKAKDNINPIGLVGTFSMESKTYSSYIEPIPNYNEVEATCRLLFTRISCKADSFESRPNFKEKKRCNLDVLPNDILLAIVECLPFPSLLNILKTYPKSCHLFNTYAAQITTKILSNTIKEDPNFATYFPFVWLDLVDDSLIKRCWFDSQYSAHTYIADTIGPTEQNGLAGEVSKKDKKKHMFDQAMGVAHLRYMNEVIHLANQILEIRNMSNDVLSAQGNRRFGTIDPSVNGIFIHPCADYRTLVHLAQKAIYHLPLKWPLGIETHSYTCNKTRTSLPLPGEECDKTIDDLCDLHKAKFAELGISAYNIKNNNVTEDEQSNVREQKHKALRDHHWKWYQEYLTGAISSAICRKKGLRRVQRDGFKTGREFLPVWNVGYMLLQRAHPSMLLKMLSLEEFEPTANANGNGNGNAGNVRNSTEDKNGGFGEGEEGKKLEEWFSKTWKETYDETFIFFDELIKAL